MPSEKMPWDKGYVWKNKWEKLDGTLAQRISLHNIDAAPWSDWSKALRPMLSLNDGFVYIEKDERYKSELISRGKLLKLPVKKTTNPKHNGCHKGSASLYSKDPSRYVIYVGFAAKKDDEPSPLWRDHTVVVDTLTKTIIESTPVKRDYYFGAPLSKARSKKFCADEGFQVRSSMPKIKRYKEQSRVVLHQAQIVDFFLKNPNARDEQVHALARDLGTTTDAFEGEIYHLLSSLLKGVGKHAHVPDAAFDPRELEMGIKVEMEHTNNEDVAKIIAKDHLTEFPDYYNRLTGMEAEAKRDDTVGLEIAVLKRLSR